MEKVIGESDLENRSVLQNRSKAPLISKEPSYEYLFCCWALF